MAGIKQLIITCALILISASTYAQITSGRIVYERRTNLEKLYKGNERVARFIKEGTKPKVEQFELYFNDTLSAFTPIESGEPEQGFMKFLTTHNKIYNNTAKNQKTAILDMWGTETVVQDTLSVRKWKIMGSKREIAGYLCHKAMWEMNDTTRIYAWYCADIVPSLGPEGFSGLPGTILGLVNEEGSLIYFAKEVKAMAPPIAKLTYAGKIKDAYTIEALKVNLLEKMGQWVKKDDLEGMFSWL
ncbi:MAG: GLPGLI family protein [Crocinitomicaceae bacterium]|jgi:GLPGLI family protein